MKVLVTGVSGFVGGAVHARLLADPRHADVTGIADETWLRLVDVPAALAARTFVAPRPVLLAVHDPLLPDNAGVYRISRDDTERVGPLGACEPELSCDAAALAILLADPFADLPRFAVVTDARRRELAFTVYEGVDDDGLPVRITEPALAPRDDLDARLAELGAQRRDVDAISGAMIALVAARALAAGRELASTEPLYLRAPDVTLPGARKKVGT